MKNKFWICASTLLVWFLGLPSVAQEEKYPPITQELLEQQASKQNTAKAKLLFDGVKKLKFYYYGPEEHTEHLKFGLSKSGAEISTSLNSEQMPKVYLSCSLLPNIAGQYLIELSVRQICKLANPASSDASSTFSAVTYEIKESAPKEKQLEAMDKTINKFVIDFLSANKEKKCAPTTKFRQK